MSLALLSPYLLAGEHESKINSICRLIASSKSPTVFLIDKSKNISTGPINLGKYGYINNDEDYNVILTDYKVIITPARLKVIPCAGSCLSVKKAKSLCPGTATYDLAYTRINKRRDINDLSWLPFKVDTYATFPDVEDPASPYPVGVTYHFEQRIVGEMYDASKKH
ncbi:hypothetical protein GCM10027277_23110 [Pseudoduganella ginsengisoli]